MPPVAISRPLAVALACLALAACGKEDPQALLAQARASLASGDFRAAEVSFKSALQADENNGPARLELGRLYLDRERYANAEKELRRARQAGQDQAVIDPLLAKALLGMGEYKRLVDEIPEPEAHDPEAVPLILARARAQQALNEREDAQASIELAQTLAPESPDVHFALAQAALADRQLDTALQRLEAALERDPKHRDSLMLKADLLRLTGKRDLARQTYESALAADPANHGAKLALAGFAIEDGQFERAKTEIDAVLKDRPAHPLANYTMALLDYKQKRYPEARDRLAKVLKPYPSHLPSLLLDGSTQFMLGNMQSAETSLKKVLATVPGNLHARRLLAGAQLRQGNLDEAWKLVTEIDLEKAADPALYLIASEIATARKDSQAASRFIQSATRLSPDNQAIRTELGLARLASGDEGALADLKQLASTDSSVRPDVAIIVEQLRKRQFDAALASVATLEKKAPKSPLASYYRGTAQLGQNDPRKARASWEQALRLQPDFFPATANLAQLDLVEKRPADAERRLLGVLKSDPNHLQALVALATLKHRQGDATSFLSYAERAQTAHPGALEPNVLLVRHYVERKDAGKALAAARAAADAFPAHPDALDALGNAQLLAGDTANALVTFSKLLKVSPNKQGARARVAAVQLKANDRAGARATLAEMLRAEPDSVPARILLGELELGAGHPDAALKLAREIIRLAPRLAAGHQLEGAAQVGLGRYADALKAYERALAIAPSSELVVYRHLALNAAGKTAEAEKRLGEWLSKYPRDAAVRTMLAESLLKSRHYKEAAGQYLEIDRLRPGDAMTLNNLAWALMEAGDRRAVQYAEKALRAAPGHAAVLDSYGWILARTGAPAKALDPLKKALQKAPNSPEIRWHLAYALNASGDREAARRELNLLFSKPAAFADLEQARQLRDQLSRP